MGVVLLIALFVGVTAQAGNTRTARKQIEASMLLTGTITIDRNGVVQAHTLNATEDLDDVLKAFVGRTIEKWRFEPILVDGTAVTAKLPMSLRLLAKPAEDGTMSVQISSTHFGSGEKFVASDEVRAVHLVPPEYPKAALQVGGRGTVYLVVEVDRDGSVINANAEQVNLRVLGSDSEMSRMRKQFTIAAVNAAKQWAFMPPTTGVSVIDGSWLVRIQMEFAFSSGSGSGGQAGKWETYLPGPRNMEIPWAREKLRTAGNPDLLSEGGVYSLRQGATLLPSPAS